MFSFCFSTPLLLHPTSTLNFYTRHKIKVFFLWRNEQEVVIDGQDKVFKDVIEPLESVSVNLIPTSKEDIRDFGPPQQVSIKQLE